MRARLVTLATARQRFPTPLVAVGIGAALLLSSYRCPFHAVTGWYCPGCGGTRALGALLRGDAVAALQDNVLMFTVLPVVAVAVVRPEGALARWLERHRTSVITAAVVIAVAYVVLRNTALPGLAPL